MTCQEVQSLLAAQRSEAPAEVFSHLEECPRCAELHSQRSRRLRELTELTPPGLPADFGAGLISRARLRPDWRDRLRRAFLPTRDDLGPAWKKLLWALGWGGACGLASAGCDLLWQLGKLPGQELDPLATALGVRASLASDLMALWPALAGVLVLLWLAWRSLAPGEVSWGRPLPPSQVAGLAAAAAALPLGLGMGLSLLLGYIDWWSFPSTATGWSWLIWLAPLAWLGLFARQRTGESPDSALSFYFTLALAALAFRLVDSWDGLRAGLGLPALYYLRFELPPLTLFGWFGLLGAGMALVLTAGAQLLAGRKRRMALAGLATGLLALEGARACLVPFGAMGEVHWSTAQYPPHNAAHEALILAPGLPSVSVADADAPDPVFRSGDYARRHQVAEADAPDPLSEVRADDFARLHQAKLAQLSRWEPTPGLQEALHVLGSLRLRRRGWWGTGPAGIPPLPAHPDLAGLAHQAHQALPDNPEVARWEEACQKPGQGVVEGQVRGPVLRLRLLPVPAGEADPVEAVRRQLDREPTYWGWTVLLTAQPDPQGHFRFEHLPEGTYVLAILAQGRGSTVEGPLPGVLSVGAGQSLELGSLEVK